MRRGLIVFAAVSGFAIWGRQKGDRRAYWGTSQLTGADLSGTANDESYSYDDNGDRTNNGYITDTYNRLESDAVYTYDYDAEQPGEADRDRHQRLRRIRVGLPQPADRRPLQ